MARVEVPKAASSTSRQQRERWMLLLRGLLLGFELRVAPLQAHHQRSGLQHEALVFRIVNNGKVVLSVIHWFFLNEPSQPLAATSPRTL
jgi:hypothetical protein